MAGSEIENLTLGGYFGIRHKFERSTKYDDVRIQIWEGLK